MLSNSFRDWFAPHGRGGDQDRSHSGDTSGDKAGMVGYPEIALFQTEPATYSAGERKQLLALARQTLQEVVVKGSLPKPEELTLPKKFLEPKGCFVTLTKNGELRGCIGNIVPQAPLYKAVVDNARSAALRDSRFSPVSEKELSHIEVEVSVLTVPQPLTFSSPDDLLGKLRPNIDGVVLKIGPSGATYLPQVWSQLPDKVEFLDHLAEKAGCPRSAWRHAGTSVLTYQVEAFKESEL